MNYPTVIAACVATLALAMSAPVRAQENALTTPLPRLHTEGQKMAGPDGKPVTLRGVNLGNWLLVEPGVFGGALGKFPDQYTLFKTLHDRFGDAEAERLIGVYRDNFIQERDVAEAKRFGINLLRVGFDYSLFEDDAKPMQLRDDAFRYTDRALQWAEKYGMYVLFDLHGAQERQVNGKQSGRAGYNRFWTDAKAQERSLWLWQQIVQHYKGRTNVLGYEALNEPWGGGQAALRDYCDKWYKMLRPIDEQTILVFPGWSSGINFYGSPTEHGWQNIAFDMHFYPGLFGWGKQGQEVHRTFLTQGLPGWRDTMSKVNAPLIIGEIKVVYPGPGTAEMTRRYYDFCAEQGWPMIQWTWKELKPKSTSPTGAWMLASNGEDLPQLDFNTSSQQEIEEFFRSLGTMPLRFDEEMRQWMTSETPPPPLESLPVETTTPAAK